MIHQIEHLLLKTNANCYFLSTYCLEKVIQCLTIFSICLGKSTQDKLSEYV